ncbi:glycosyltransferase family 4 protein [Robiginitalea sediminis]|uniref:glycosyltransferase family 4 protein n=1 Tax=Robiginitalea sediminis TaxID=1982593 RepID=UPI000B4BD006|nr:glycosyltransferase family 4 protein [Robiginitalea sediminis]
MKIDFIISTIRGGGAERVMSILVNKFCQEGHQVRLITFKDGEDAYPIDPQVQRLHFNKKVLPNAKINALFHLVRLYRKKADRPDAAISFLTLMNLVAILACRLFRIPVVVSEHNNHLQLEAPAWLTKLAWKKVYRKANAVTVLTSYDIPFFRELGCQVAVMPNPCTFVPAVEYHAQRKQDIVAVGNLNRYHHKGFDNLLEIAGPVLRERPDWRLRIIGDGAEGKHFLSQRVNDLGLESQVSFPGFRSDIQPILLESAIFILPSRFEGLPMVLLEALSQGTACIAYDCITGPSDMIEHRQNGLLVPDQDIKAMQQELAALMDNRELRETLGRNGISSLDRYSTDAIYSQWMGLLAKATQ